MTRKAIWILVASLGISALIGGVLVVVFVVVFPSPGTPVASVAIRPDVPFEVQWVADGYPKRAWLDFDCHGCTFPFRGSAVVEADGVQVASVPLEVWTTGYAVYHYEGGDEEEMTGKLLFDVPALPSGARARIRAVLSVPAPTLVWSSDGDLRAPPPRFESMRFWIAQ